MLYFLQVRLWDGNLGDVTMNILVIFKSSFFVRSIIHLRFDKKKLKGAARTRAFCNATHSLYDFKLASNANTLYKIRFTHKS